MLSAPRSKLYLEAGSRDILFKPHVAAAPDHLADHTSSTFPQTYEFLHTVLHLLTHAFARMCGFSLLWLHGIRKRGMHSNGPQPSNTACCCSCRFPALQADTQAQQPRYCSRIIGMHAGVALWALLRYQVM